MSTFIREVVEDELCKCLEQNPNLPKEFTIRLSAEEFTEFLDEEIQALIDFKAIETMLDSLMYAEPHRIYLKIGEHTVIIEHEGSSIGEEIH